MNKYKTLVIASCLSIVLASPIAALAHGNESERAGESHGGRATATVTTSANSTVSANTVTVSKSDDSRRGETHTDNGRHRGRGRGHDGNDNRGRDHDEDNDDHATTTPPVVATTTPIISNIMAFIGSKSVRFTWTTDVLTNSEVYFSTTSPVTIGGTTTSAVIDPLLTLNHSITVGNLATSTLYNFIIRSTSAASTTQSTGQFSLTTESGL